MPRKKNSPKGSSMEVRMQEITRQRHTHNSMVDYLHGRPPFGSFLNVFAPNFFGLNFRGPFEDDYVYFYQDAWFPAPYPENRPRSPGAQIRELTDQEMEDILKSVKEEEQRKIKRERNKRKKMRKKEKKRLEKENAEKDKSEDEDDDDDDDDDEEEEEEEEEEVEESTLTANFSEARLENPTVDNKEMSNDANKPSKCNNFHILQNKTLPPAGEESSGDNERFNEKLKAVVNKDEHKEQKESDFKLPCETTSAETVPVEQCKQKPRKDKENKISEPIKVLKEGKREKSEPIKVLKEELKTDMINSVEAQNGKKNVKISEKPEISKEELPTIVIQNSARPSVDEFGRRSIELGGIGNRLAASGQFEMAVKYFTDAIKLNPTEYKLFGNRSLCYERLQQYRKALSDADLALSMQPNWIKGLFRKGKALSGLKRFYEASLVYKKVLELESTSVEAAEELKRTQILHLMEMGFSWSESSEVLKTHPSLEDAVEALFLGENETHPQGKPLENGAVADHQAQQEEDDVEGEWTVQSGRSRTQHKTLNGTGEVRVKSQQMPRSRSSAQTELFPVWVGSLSPSMTYMRLHELFSRAGTVYSIKMLLDQDCAFVNFTRREDCDQAIKCLNGMVVDGAPLTIRYPLKVHTQLGASKSALTDPRVSKECFFWRTTGCIKSDCTFEHILAHKGMDRERFTSRLGYAGNSK